MYQNQQQNTPNKMQQREINKCFRCHQPGHWANNCPVNRSPISPPQTTTTTDPVFPSIPCRCGAGLCHIGISGSSNNPGRKYYKCPGLYEKYCRYFLWCDKPRQDNIPEVQLESFPMCGCGAGVSTLLIEENGPNAGRKYFGCHIKKGEGACNFKQWLDNSPPTSLSEDMITEQHDKLVGFELSDEVVMQIDDALQRSACEPPSEDVQVQVTDHALPLQEIQVEMKSQGLSSQDVHVQMVDSELPMVEVHVQMEDGKVENACDRPDETSEGSTEGHSLSVLNNISENHESVVLQNSVDDSATENVQALVTALTPPLSNPLSQDLLLKYMMAYLPQEPVRLTQVAYPFGHVTISAVTSFCSGSFPNVDPVILPEENALTPFVMEDSSTENSSHGLDKQAWTVPPVNPSGLLKDHCDEGSIMSGTILQAFEKLAFHLQQDLITLLESMEAHNNGIMMNEAKCTFAALDCLHVDYGLFRFRITEYITQAAALAQFGQTISKDDSSQELLKRYKNEKSRFDEISHAYCEASAAFMASSKRLSLLREQASCLKDMLDELETELSCCEAENTANQDSMLRLTETMLQCKESLRVTFQEAAEALKQSEKREIKMSAAKAAFEKARAQLRK